MTAHIRSTEWLSLLLLVSALPACGTQPLLEPIKHNQSELEKPDGLALEYAQADLIHRELGDGGMVHCLRFEALRCRPAQQTETYNCSYREWAERRPWPTKTATIKRGGERYPWSWVAGDPPTCSITVFEKS